MKTDNKRTAPWAMPFGRCPFPCCLSAYILPSKVPVSTISA